jgi:hypothetical protein
MAAQIMDGGCSPAGAGTARSLSKDNIEALAGELGKLKAKIYLLIHC